MTWKKGRPAEQAAKLRQGRLGISDTIHVLRVCNTFVILLEL